MTIRKNIATSDEGFIFNPATGDSFTTNSLGAEIIALLKEDKKLPDIITAICEKYNVEEAQFEKDLDDFISQLKESSIME
jgi:PqqD family protein of HPr-rel-A system